MSKQILIFLFFLILSGIFWLILTLNESYEQEIKVVYTIRGIPKNVVLTSNEIDTFRVTVRDKGWMIFQYLYKEKRSVIINYKSFDRGNGFGIVSTSEVRRLLSQQLESSSLISSVKPDRLEFFYNNGERKRVPVRWAGHVNPEQLYFISHVQYMPDSVDVYTSREKLDSIKVVYTEPLNYTGFRDTLLIDCKLSHQKDVKVVPEHIRIGFYTDVLTEESMEGVPIKAINMPEGKVLRTFPARVQVKFVVGASMFRTLSADQFRVVVDYNELQAHPSDKCTLHLQRYPQAVRRIRLSMSRIDYLIEQQ
jgi:hypothetical protein